MSLQLATKKVTYENFGATARTTSKGTAIVLNHKERQALATHALNKLLHINSIRPQRYLNRFFSKISDARSTNDTFRLLKIQKNNNLQVESAIDTNYQELRALQTSPPDSDNVSTTPERVQHLKEEIFALRQIRANIGRHQQLLGFIGDGKDALAHFTQGTRKTFGAHSFAIIKDLTTKQIKLREITTTLHQQQFESEASFSSTLPSMHVRSGDHAQNQTIAEAIQPPRGDANNRKSLRESLFGRKQTVSTGAESAAAACCSITSLDELANVGQRTDHNHGEIITPKNASDGVLTGFVSYASIAGIKIARDIYKNYHETEQRISKAQESLELLKLENQATKNNPLFADKHNAIQACERFLRQQKSEARFQKRVAGILSGIGSLSILVGQFVAKVSPIGLYLLSAFGAGHVYHIGKQLINACKDFKESAPGSIERHHFYKKIKNLGLALASWSFYTAGTTTLGTMSLGMMGFAIQTGAAPAIVAGGIIALGVGIAGSVIYNNIVTSRRFYPGMPMKGRLDPANPPLERDVQNRLERSRQLRAISKSYRAYTFDHLRKQKPLNLAIHTAKRYLNKFGIYATLGLYPAPFMDNKFKIKGALARLLQNQQQQRLESLRKLHGMNDVPQLSNGDAATFQGNITEFEAAGEILLNQTSVSGDKPKLIVEIKALLDVLRNTPNSDQIVKLFAKKVIQPRTQIKPKVGSSDHHGLIGQWIPNIKRQLFIDEKITDLFTGNPEAIPSKTPIMNTDQSTENVTLMSYKPLNDAAYWLATLYAVKPCCSSVLPTNMLLEELTDTLKPEGQISFESLQNLKTRLYESIDQYLLFQARNNAKEDIALYANYLRGFD